MGRGWNGERVEWGEGGEGGSIARGQGEEGQYNSLNSRPSVAETPRASAKERGAGDQEGRAGRRNKVV